MGPRRFGKTSFVLNLLKQLEKENYKCVFVDIFNITSHRDFLHQLLRSIRAKESYLASIKQWFKKATRLNPQLSASFEPVTGASHFNFTLGEMAEESVSLHRKPYRAMENRLISN